ncbi:aminotransferase class V-fold PLP-dependent enzyme [Microbacterium elymi]|uniref:Aminotransferase class V-fold PLP-dependent enzyme n=1 Tax=Microbacterium elymi TaxID=2909587 RepID=A0ABY5NK92_9MICO|nr:aminotransferase class V-fold PLP-dependent enzyme [Microbacterium elymi]UUT35573.1 aminotransferase class V-fold PLP-dependent enzyme [Microbacterium elymi]
MSDLEAYLATFGAEPGYLDWAAFGPLSVGVRTEAHADAELLSTGRRSSIEMVAGRADVARALLAGLLDAPLEQIALQPSTTYGLMQALYGVDGGLLLSRAEFPSLTVAATRAAALREGLAVHWIDPDDGFMTPEAVRAALTDEITAVAVSQVDYRTGYAVDLTALRDVIGDRLLIVDAVQGFGVTDADYAAADVVCGNGYKWLRAGRGTGWSRFSGRALERITPVLSGFAGADGDLPMQPVPAPASDARAFTVTGSDHLAAGRLATALEELREAGVPAVASAVADRADEIVYYAERYEVPIVTPREREHRAGIVTLAPVGADPSSLAAALVNRGVTFTARGGQLRLAAHAATDEDTMRLLGDALAEFATTRQW